MSSYDLYNTYSLLPDVSDYYIKQRHGRYYRALLEKKVKLEEMAKQLEKSNSDYEFIESELRLSEAREENLNDEKEEILQKKEEIIEEKHREIARLTAAYNDIQQLKAIELAQLDAEFAKMKEIIEEKEEEIANFEVKC